MNDNKEKQSLDKYEDENKKKYIKYVLFPFVTSLLLPQKESNRSTDMSKGTKSLNHLVCISKIGYLYNC